MTATQLPTGCKFVRMEDAGRFNLPIQAMVVHKGLVEELKYGDHVKVALDFGTGVEKFWCVFGSYDHAQDLMHLVVSNDLVYTNIHGLDDGDHIIIPSEFLCAALLG